MVKEGALSDSSRPGVPLLPESQSLSAHSLGCSWTCPWCWQGWDLEVGRQ